MIGLLKRAKRDDKASNTRSVGGVRYVLPVGYGFEGASQLFLPNGKTILVKKVIASDPCRITYVDPRGEIRVEKICSDSDTTDHGGTSHPVNDSSSINI